MLVPLLLALGSCWAGEPVPPSPPAAAAAVAPAQLVPITAELLQRWGYDADKVQSLPPAKRAELQKELTMLEIGRLRKLEVLRQIKPNDWRSYVTEEELLTPEGVKIVGDYLAKLKDKPMLVPAEIKDFKRADGKPLTPEDFAKAQAMLDHMFDGVAAHGKDLAGEVIVDAHVRNETVYDMTITNPRTGLSVSVGQLFVDERHPNATNSPYVNLGWNKDSKPDSGVDYRFKASLGYVDLKSRFFADDVPSPQVSQALSLGGSLGLPQDKLNQLSQYMTYDDPYKTHGIVVTSLLAELGRAYNLYGPLDLSWTIGNLTKTMWVAPNTAFDETLGLRVRLNGGLSLGIFGGATQNVSPVGNHLFQELIDNQTVRPGLNVENAPHVGVAVWGKVPGVSDLQFSAAGTQRWNNDTQVHEVTGSLMTTFLKHPLAVQGTYARETGTAIEFDRQKTRLELDYHFSQNSEAFIAAERDRITYGNAKVDSDALMAGFKIDFGGSGSTLTMDHLFGGKYQGGEVERKHMQEALSAVNNNLSAALNVVDKADAAYAKIRPDLNPAALESQLNQLSAALSRLDPDTATHLIDELSKHGLSDAQRQALMNLWLRTVSPGSAYYKDIQSRIAQDKQLLQQAGAILSKLDNWSQWYEAHRGDLQRLLALLTNEQVWDAAVIQAARGQLLKAMNDIGKVKIPIMGGIDLQIDAPAILASANILNSRLSPIAPVKEGQLDGWLLREAGVSLGVGPNATDQQVAAALFGLADQQMKQQLTQQLAPLMAQIGNLTPQQLSSQILADVPPPVAAMLKQKYGVSLAGLIPPNLPPGQIKDIVAKLPDQITAMLEQQYGKQLASGIAQAVSWAADLIRREINMTMIQLMLASEELDRLTVDHGNKIDDLDLRMAMRSFDMLDERGKQQAMRQVSDLKAATLDQARADDARLADRFLDHGKQTLRDLQLDPSWPEGLKVQVDDKSWLPLLTMYGDGGIFGLIDKLKEEYKTKPHPQGLAITLNFSKDQAYGSSIWRDPKKGTLRFDLGPVRDAREAAFRLQSLRGYAD